MIIFGVIRRSSKRFYLDLRASRIFLDEERERDLDLFEFLLRYPLLRLRLLRRLSPRLRLRLSLRLLVRRLAIVFFLESDRERERERDRELLFLFDEFDLLEL